RRRQTQGGAAAGHEQRRAGGGAVVGASGAARLSGYTAPHCGSLRASDAGSEVELYGWVARRRDMGGLIFIDLRDRWGKVQLVFNRAPAPAAQAAASNVRAEYVVHVTGAIG